MITTEKVILIHNELIDTFGGSKGLRDRATLESALNRPFQTFDGIELYKTIEEKAAAIIESLLINHPFIDGNKRIGYVMMRLLLLSENMVLEASEDERYDFVISIASGERKIETITEWIRENRRYL